MRDAGIVDQQRQRLVRAQVGYRGDADVGVEIGYDRADREVRELGCEFSEPIFTATNDDQLIPLARQAAGKYPTDAGGRPRDERELR